MNKWDLDGRGLHLFEGTNAIPSDKGDTEDSFRITSIPVGTQAATS